MKFAAGYTSFKCALCEVVNDTAFSGAFEGGENCFGSLQHLSLEECILLTKKVFSSQQNVVCTFSVYSAEEQQKVLDVAKINSFYAAVMQSSSQTLKNALMMSMHKLLERPKRPICTIEGFLFVVVCLLNPLFLHSKEQAEIFFHQTMLQRLFGLASNGVYSTAGLEREVIRCIGREMQTAELRKIVEMANFFITQRLLVREIGINSSNIYSDWGISASLKVLALAVASNDARRRIPIAEFYNSGLDTVNLIYDFESWKASRTFRAAGTHFYICNYAFAISLAAKMKIFHYEAEKEQGILADQAIIESLFHFEPINPFLHLKIRRERIMFDSLTQLTSQKAHLRKKLRVEFTNEIGLDAGGLAKEWLLLLVRELFHPTQGLFYVETESNLLWFCATADSMKKMEIYNLCGIIMGLAIYNGILLDISFPLLCYKKLLGQKGNFEDLKELMPERHRNMRTLLQYKELDFEQVFSLDFSYWDRDLNQQVFFAKEHKQPVTLENCNQYTEILTDYLLNGRISSIFEAFRMGFMQVCNGNALHLFRPCEIEALVSGSKEKQIPVQIIRQNSAYTNGFQPEEPTVQRFWELFEAFDERMKRALLRFVTGTDRLPSVGNAADFGITLTCMGEDCQRLPVAHTCFNQICLYRYRSKEKMQKKLVLAIEETSGFDLK